MQENDAPAAAKALSAALDAVEAELDRLASGPDPDGVALALKAPVRALDAAAKEALS